MEHEVRWIDSGREPKVKPDPAWPNGVDLDTGVRPACRVELPYPAKRIGYYLITCYQCDTQAVCTTAGRPDDPRSMMVPCKIGASEWTLAPCVKFQSVK